MAEYIEREAAIRVVNGQSSLTMTRSSLIDSISNIPAADVAPVVRCMDCKYWQDNNDGYPHEECRWGHGETPDDNDFCSYGERMDGGSNAEAD